MSNESTKDVLLEVVKSLSSTIMKVATKLVEVEAKVAELEARIESNERDISALFRGDGIRE